ncbi:hypothetical protein EV175_005967 [Coemansia sp. RSA 1933]|nr:hypothetical protein EV175_005967 [Coemansia sp. RSA 1933]
METVVDLTESPPLATSFPGPTSAGTQNASVLISSDDENNGNSNISSGRSSVVLTGTSGIPSLPEGMVLPPIRRVPSNEQGRPERITTLRDVLSTQLSRNRARSGMARARAGYRVPANYARAPVYSTADIHTGEEPVEIGVYNPIRARPMLRHERQEQQQQQQQQLLRQQQLQRQRQLQQSRSRSTSEAVALEGRETADGAIDVEEVDETTYNNQQARRAQQQQSEEVEFRGIIRGAGAESDDSDRDYVYGDYEDEDRSSPMDGMDYEDIAMDEDMMQNSLMLLQHRTPRRRGRGDNGRGAHEAFIFPFHPGLIPHGLMQRGGGGGRFNPMDYYGNEDIGNLLSFLEATTPAQPPSRPLTPLEPLKLSANQAKLAESDDYSRRVPQANFRETAAAGRLEIVCTQCTGSLYEREAIWAPSCGHILCNPCVDGISGASKTCTACKKRISKKSLVHVYA